ncbi:MAG: hypothetical protein ACRDPG_08065 [Nocardioidaceae bacterium]
MAVAETIIGESGGDGLTQCWCCSSRETRERMVALGNHPEVVVCVRCAHSLSKWAWEIEDRGKRSPGSRARDGFRSVRKHVVSRGWHQSRWVGPPLRWLGRHLP